MKKLSMIVLAILAVAWLAPAAWGQMATVKGSAKDENGQPITGAVVRMVGKETGRKYELKTDKKGEFFSLGVSSGSYTVTLLKDGNQILQFSNVPVRLGEENTIVFDLAKERQRAEASRTPEQRKQAEEQQKEVAKIKGLNEKLAEANDLQQAGNFDQAVQVLTETTQVAPNEHLLWFKLGDAQRLAASKNSDKAAASQQYQAAVESYKKAISLVGPTKPEALGAYYNNLGEAYAKMNDTPEAVKAYDQAAQSDPVRAGQYYFNEGAVLTNSGKSEDANVAFDKAIQADPTRAEAYYWKGVNLMAKAKLVGDKTEAPPGTAEAFNKYLELQPTGQFAEPAKQMLATIGAKIETSFGKPRTKKK